MNKTQRKTVVYTLYNIFLGLFITAFPLVTMMLFSLLDTVMLTLSILFYFIGTYLLVSIIRMDVAVYKEGIDKGIKYRSDEIIK
jgi:hypothetical protein